MEGSSKFVRYLVVKLGMSYYVSIRCFVSPFRRWVCVIADFNNQDVLSFHLHKLFIRHGWSLIGFSCR